MTYYKHFKHLHVPDHWEHYWSKYPQGYTIMEALISWVSQVDFMTDNVNDWNAYLETFVETFDMKLQDTVREMIQELYDSGQLAELTAQVIDVVQDQISVVSSQLVQTKQDVEERGYNILKDGTSQTNDWTAIFNEALENYDHIFVPSHTYKVYGMIELDWNQTITLANGAVLEKPEDSDNTDPVIWVKGCYGSILGSGLKSSLIKSHKPSPKGVVRMGMRDMEDTEGRNVLYNNIHDIGIVGRKPGGEETGSESYGLYMASQEINSLATYFNNIRNVYFQDLNTGLMMEGYVNANIISDLNFWDVGNEQWLDSAAIKMRNVGGKYPLENVITNVFMHYGHNGICLYLDGDVHFNTLTNILAEPFGDLARWLKVTGENTRGNIITGVDNVNRVWDVTENFTKNNTIIRRHNVFTGRVESSTLETEEGSIDCLSIGTTKNKQGSFITSQLAENTAYNLLNVDIGNQRQTSGLVKLSFTLDTLNGLTINRTGEIVYSIQVTATGTINVRELNVINETTVLIKPIVDGTIIKFGARVPNNGTDSKVTRVNVYYSIQGSFYDTITEIGDNPPIIDTESYTSQLPQSTQNGGVNNRPNNAVVGELYYDISINKPIWYTTQGWRDATGALV